MKASDFTDYLLEQVTNHSLYIWGGQGESIDKLSFADIREMETSTDHLSDIYSLYAKDVKAGYDMRNARAFDCSGLGVYFFLKHGMITSDKTANALYQLGIPIDVSKAREGDFVFKSKSSTGAWQHIGYVISYNGKLVVVEAKGRSYGVVLSSLSGWKAASRPLWWDVTFSRSLKIGMSGVDVTALQVLLIKQGYALVADGEFGSETEKAVISYQVSKGLAVDGIAGRKTIVALGGIMAK